MSNCYSLEILDDVKGIASHQYNGDSGGVFVDMPEDANLTIEENRGELNDLNQIKIDAAYSVTASFTKINNLLFFYWFKIGILDRVYSPLRMVAKIQGIPIKQQYLYPKSKNNQNCSYDLEITYGKEHWSTKMGECTLRDIPLEENEFEFIIDNIQPNWQDFEWNDGDPIYQWIPAWTGDTIEPNTYQLEDFRPVWSTYGLIKASQKKIGWCIDIPLLEVYPYNCMWEYLTQNYNDETVLLDSLKFKVCWNANEYFNGFAPPQMLEIPFDEYILTNFFDINTNEYNHNGLSTYKISGKVEFTDKFANPQYDPFVSVPHNNLSIELIVGDRSTFFNTNQSGEFSFETDEIYASSEEIIKFRHSYEGEGTIGRICISNCPISSTYQDGDTIQMNTLLSEEDSLLDRMKGLVHLFNFKIEEDCVTKRLTFRPPFNVKCPQPNGEDVIIEGYNRNKTVDVSEYVVCDSLLTSTPQYKRPRYCVYGFKKASDDAIKDLEKYKDTKYQPFDHEVDNGKLYKDKRKFKRNPYYEPTINVELSNHSINAPIHLPSIQKNTPRIFFIKGGAQFYTDGGESKPTALRYKDSGYQFIPNVSLDYASENFTIQQHPDLDASIGYERNYQKFYKREEFQKNGANSYSIDLCISYNEFLKIKFNNRLSFEADECFFDIFPIKKTYEACSRTATIIGFEERKVLTNCETLGDPTGSGNGNDGNGMQCQNFPEIMCEKVGNCYQFSLGGQYESEVSNVIFEYQYLDPTEAWQPLTNTGNWTAEVCSPTRRFRVRMQVQFADGCPSIYRTVVKDGCVNEPDYIWDCFIRNGQTCFKIQLGGNYESDISTHTYELQLDGEVVPYTLGDEYCFSLSQAGQNIVASINGIVSYADGCEDSEIDSVKTFPPEQINCALTDATAVCVQDDNGCFTFDYEGIVATNVAIEMYQYECDGVKGYWKRGDDPICCTTLRVKLILIFCDTCPVYCQPDWTECETNCPTGNVSMNCVDCMLAIIIDGYDGYAWTFAAPNNEEIAFASGQAIELPIDGIYTLTGTLDGCPTIIETFNHETPHAGIGGTTIIE